MTGHKQPGWRTQSALLLCAGSAAWPLTQLIWGSTLLAPTAGAIAVVVGVGALCRRFAWRGPMTLLAQVFAMVVAVQMALLTRGVLLWPSHLAALQQDVNSTVHRWAAPMPTSAGISAVIVAAAVFIALVVDYVGGTARMPVFVAVPMLVPFALAAAAIGHLLPMRYFIAAAAAWAFLLFTSPQVKSPAVSVTWMGTAVCVILVALAITTGILATPHLPHRAAPELGQHKGSGVDTSVDFTRSLDLRKSLHSNNSAPVLEYDTTARYPAPLRVTTSSVYQDGIWQANALDGPSISAKPQTALPIPGLSPHTPVLSSHTSVIVNGMKSPLVATPSLLHAANFGSENPTFRLVTASSVPLVDHKPGAYAVLTYDFAASARPSKQTNAHTSAPSVSDDDLDVNMLSDSTMNRVSALAHTNGTENATPFERAVAIQRYLRVGGHFTYTLTAPTAAVGDTTADPIAAFLETKQGYCTQFATAMVMAARLDGIPARMAIGFLPGQKKNGHYVVRAADAHAWPELYFPGMGWTRFDPTPPGRSGGAPAYAPDGTAKHTADSTPSSRPKPTPSPTASTTSSPTHVQSPQSGTSSTLAMLARGLGIFIIVVAAASALPLAGRRERERLLRTASSDREREEGHWHAMRWALADLGFVLRDDREPRALLATFRQNYPNRGPLLDSALARASEAIEQSRYRPDPAPSAEKASRDVRNAAREEASTMRKLHAALIPASGVQYMRELFRRR